MSNTTLQIRHSTVAGNVPSSLANGEIALNSKDGRLFYSTPAGVVTSFSTGPSGLDTEIQFNDAGSVGGSEKLTFNKTTGLLTVNGTVRANIFSDDGVDLYDFSNRAFTTANAAFAAANNATDTYVRNHANSAFAAANSSGVYANAAFAAANAATAVNNTQNNSITVALNTANAALAQANTVSTLAPVVYETTSNGTVSTFSLGFNPISREAVMVSISGIIQPTSTYTVDTSDNTISFSEIPENGELVRVASFYSNANISYYQSLPANVTPSIFETTGDGETSTFSLGFNPGSVASLMVSIGGVLQPTSAYSVNTVTKTITFLDDAPEYDEVVQVTSFYSATNAYVINDGSISFLKLDANLSSRFIDTQNRTNAAYDAANTASAAATDQYARNRVNASFAAANSASDIAGSAFLKSNLAYSVATTNAIDIVARNISNSAFASANAINGVDITQNNRIAYSETTANAAFASANLINGIDLLQNNRIAYSETTANAAFASANLINGVDITQNNNIIVALNTANAAFVLGNSIAGIDTTQNNSITASFIRANSAWNTANAAFNAANNATDTFVRNQANAAFNTGNSAFNQANAAFIRANNSLDANNGGVVSGNLTVSQDLVVSGNLTVIGNTYSINAGSTTSTSPLYVFALNNYTTDLIDIGFVGHYNDGVNAHTGLIRDAGTKEWHLFKGYVPQITANNNILIDDPTFQIDTLNANLHSTTITIKNIDILPYANNIYNTANAAFSAANNALDTWVRGQTNAAFIVANSAYGSQNATGQYANAAFITANAAFNAANNATDTFVRNQANAAFNTGNSAFTQANAAFNAANNATDLWARNQANAAFNAANNATDTFVRNQANASFIQANAAFNKANSLVGFTRTTITTTTASLAVNASANAIVTMAKGYVLYKIAVSTGAWVTLYSNTALANADWTRSITTDPNPGSGVIAESITTGFAANVTYFTPAVYGMNDDVSVNSNGYLKIYNNSNGTNTVTVTLTYLPLEV